MSCIYLYLQICHSLKTCVPVPEYLWFIQCHWQNMRMVTYITRGSSEPVSIAWSFICYASDYPFVSSILSSGKFKYVSGEKPFIHITNAMWCMPTWISYPHKKNEHFLRNYHNSGESFCWITMYNWDAELVHEWVGGYCFTTSEQYLITHLVTSNFLFKYIMTRTSYFQWDDKNERFVLNQHA